MLEALKNAPDWVQWLVAIGTPIAAFFAKDVWAWYKEARKTKLEREEKFVERRVTHMDREINRALQLKDELIAELKSTISEKNLAIKGLLEEVKLCRHEREAFVKLSGDQAATLAEANANLAHTRAELADSEVEIANLKKQLAALEPRAAVVEEAKGDARQLFNKLDGASVTPTPVEPAQGTTQQS